MVTQPINIASYSVGGHTRDAVARLAATLDDTATTEEIRPAKPPSGLFGYFRMAWSAFREQPWSIEAPLPYRQGCRLLIIGTPMWVGRITPPVNEYLSRVGAAYPAIAVLITLGGSKPKRALAQVGELTGKEPVASVALSDEDRKKGRSDAKIDDFAATLRSRL